MDKKAILAVFLSLGIWMVWQKFYLEPIQKQAALHTEVKKSAELVREENRQKIDTVGILPETLRQKGLRKASAKEVTLQSAHASLVISNESDTIKNWELKDFSTELDKKGEMITTKTVTGVPNQFRIRFSDSELTEVVNSTWDTLAQTNDRTVVSELNAEKLKAKKTIQVDENGFSLLVSLDFRFQKEAPKFVFLDLYGNKTRPNDKEGSIFGQAPDKVHASYRDANGRHSEIGASLKQDLESAANVKWVGLDTRYFVLALVPDGEAKTGAGVQVSSEQVATESFVRNSLVIPTNGQTAFSVPVKVYFGPKQMDLLKATDPALADTIDFGWTTFIAVPLLQALRWFYEYVKNYGLAIILLTFVIKMLLFPLTYKSMKSMAKMSKLQPQLNALREKYKDDKEKLNTEMMSFMKTNGYNPVGGCLPILLQMPIFFALYRVLFNSMELYQAPFFGWMQDLSSPDPYFITPVLLTGLMYLQQKLSPSTATDPAQQKMLQFMPVMFGVFMLMLPAGLNIYMLVNSAVSILQQWYLNHKLQIYPQKK